MLYNIRFIILTLNSWCKYCVFFFIELLAENQGKVDNIEYQNIKNLTSKKWLKSGELEIPYVGLKVWVESVELNFGIW